MSLSSIIFVITIFAFKLVAAQPTLRCKVPSHLRGNYYTHERGQDIDTIINENSLKIANINTDYAQNSECIEISNMTNSGDAYGRFDAKLLFYDSQSGSYWCWELYYRTPMVLQFRQFREKTLNLKRLPDICNKISDGAALLTMFKTTEEKVNCKPTIEGSYHFSYEVSLGGGGICNSERSEVIACQEPGSKYIDNEVFIMNFAKCDDVSTSNNERIRFQCLGSWQDKLGNYYSAVADTKHETNRDRYRCMLTRKDQQIQNNEVRWSLSRWAGCSTLQSPYEGDIRLVMWPKSYIRERTLPSCNLPRDYTGTWFTTGEFDTNVKINSTHIYFNTKLDQYTYKETYFTCKMVLDGRYLMTANTVGKCEVDYVCFDFVPRHHNIIRWRLSLPFRVTAAEMDRDDYLFRKFKQTCTWTSFTINRLNFEWNYQTFLLNPPAPVNCPIAGRFKFTQIGNEEEKYTTRIRGITERPRHTIDCREYVTEFKACANNAKKIYIDAEYCATVDHTGKPIGEYDIADRELTCAGYWMEDMKSYMITYDEEDAVSKFRCWVYERLDWRIMRLSRATRAQCSSKQTAISYLADEGASLAMYLKENERIFDDCPIRFDTGANPFEKDEIVHVLNEKSAANHGKVYFMLLINSFIVHIVFYF